MSDETRKFEEFEALLGGGSGFSEGELGELAALARALERARPAAQAPAPRPDFRAALRTRLLEEATHAVVIPLPLHARVRASVAARNVRIRRSFRTVAAVAAATMVMLVGSTLVAAAQGTVPGDALYRIKRAHENIALKAVFGRVPRAQRQLELARERLEEVRILSQRGEENAALFVGALADMDARTLDATTMLINEYRKTRDNGLLGMLIAFSGAQRQGLEAIVDEIPAGAVPKTRSSIELVDAVQNRVSAVLGGCPCPAEALTPAANATPGTPGGVTCGCGATRPGSTPAPKGQSSPPAVEQPKGEDPDGGDNAEDGSTGPLPDLTDTDVEEQLNDLVNDLLENLGVTPPPVPTAAPSLPLP